MSKNLYEVLWVAKTATADEIKKAYRKLAMQYHPDKNKGDETAEKKFKEINEAYQTLSDEGKRKQYDTFGSTGNFWAWGNPFWGAWGAGWFGGFEDIFSGFWWGGGRGQNVEFDFGDLFGNMWGSGRDRGSYQYDTRREAPKQPESLDFEKTYEIPVFDLILGCKIEVTGVYGQKAKLKIPEWTKSWAKFRVKEFGKSEGAKKWNLIVKVEALMPKSISDTDKRLLEQIRDNIGY